MKISALEKLVEQRLNVFFDKKQINEGSGSEQIKLGNMIWDANQIEMPKKLEDVGKKYYELLIMGDVVGHFIRLKNDSGILYINNKEYKFSKNNIRLVV